MTPFPVSYLIYLKRLLFENIAHVGSFSAFALAVLILANSAAVGEKSLHTVLTNPYETRRSFVETNPGRVGYCFVEFFVVSQTFLFPNGEFGMIFSEYEKELQQYLQHWE